MTYRKPTKYPVQLKGWVSKDQKRRYRRQAKLRGLNDSEYMRLLIDSDFGANNEGIPLSTDTGIDLL